MTVLPKIIPRCRVTCLYHAVLERKPGDLEARETR